MNKQSTVGIDNAVNELNTKRDHRNPKLRSKRLPGWYPAVTLLTAIVSGAASTVLLVVFNDLI